MTITPPHSCRQQTAKKPSTANTAKMLKRTAIGIIIIIYVKKRNVQILQHRIHAMLMERQEVLLEVFVYGLSQNILVVVLIGLSRVLVLVTEIFV
jgi:hypothetical protein